MLTFVRIISSQAICTADLPGSVHICRGVKPFRGSGMWPRKQLGYADEVLPSQCGLNASSHAPQCYRILHCIENNCCIKSQCQLFEFVPFVFKSDFKFLCGSWINLEHMRLNHFPHFCLPHQPLVIFFKDLGAFIF